MKLKRWYVITPEYDTVIPIFDGTGPVESGRDWIEIEAATKRDAIALGVKEMLKNRDKYVRYEWCKSARMDGISPFAGVVAEPVSERYS